MFFQLLQDVVASSLNVMMFACTGIILYRLKKLSLENCQMISKLLEEAFLPCLSFYTFIKSFDSSDTEIWVPACFISQLIILQGFLTGYLFNKYFIQNKQIESLVVLSNGYAHTLIIHISLSYSLKDYLDVAVGQFFKLNPKITQSDGFLMASNYIIIFNIMNNLSRWSLAQFMMLKMSEDKIPKLQENTQVGTLNSNNESFLSNCKSVFNPPLIASLLAVIISFFEPLKNQLQNSSTFLGRGILGTTEILGRASAPLVMINVGANLQASFGYKTKVKSSEIVLICISQLVVLPLIGFCTIFILIKLNIIRDPILAFVASMSYSMPVAYSMLVVSSNHTDLGLEMAQIISMTFFASIITIPIVIMVSLNYFIISY